MRKQTLILLLASTVLAASFGQTRQAIVRIAPFSVSGVGTSEASMLERLVSSYVTELKTFRVVDDRGQEMALNETEAALAQGRTGAVPSMLTADFIIEGTVGKIGDVFAFTLGVTKVSNGEKLYVSDTAPSISDIVLRARALTRSLFDQDGAADEVAADPPVAGADNSGSGGSLSSVAVKTPTPDDLIGTWRGDKGLETVRIFPNGTGLAILSGGGTLKIRVAIAGDAVQVSQDQPNDVAMYRATSMSFEIAKRIAAEARPMRWLFALSSDGTTLFGKKESVSISGTGSSLEIDNGYVREASWVRISR
ncbi:MAG: hypothetical protein CVV47_01175 [Spirochaetae bacterium HGW-Spirochaetae-3]|jgi:hypothetical protein|nr:MAG: hypothetical protein CVV47_01175 [Spirochaetae bacterium HGW-Spirochaetae-3]